MKHKVGLAQVAPLLGNREKNLEMCMGALERAKAQGCEWVIFPELALTGYLVRDLVPDLAVGLDDEALTPFLEASNETAITLGLIEETADYRFCNSAVHMEGGEILHVHRKVYLPTYGMFDEGRYFSPGRRVRAFNSRFGRIGLLVCEDAWHPSLPYILAQDGAEILVVISSSPARAVKGEHIESSQAWGFIVRVYSELFRSYVIYVNRSGYEEGVSFSGASRASSPAGVTIAEGVPLEEQLVIAEISSGEVRRARLSEPLLRDERLELTIRELERIARERDRGQY